MVKKIYIRNLRKTIGLVGILIALGENIESSYSNIFSKNLSKTKYEIENMQNRKTYTELAMKDSLDKKEIQTYLNDALEKVKLPAYITEKYVYTLIDCESEWGPLKINQDIAKGLGQLTEKTWENREPEFPYEVGVFIPSKNLEVTLKHLKWLDKYCEERYPKWKTLPDKKKLELISASYNGGAPRLYKRKWNIQRMPRETRNHVRKMNKKMEKKTKFRALHSKIAAINKTSNAKKHN